ncbi:DUF4097 family beta strand repeat-containing protein [Actinoplanes sp. NPDC051633]|uniref:DUF4097 family beta strand repeat-containing protein n=1 Tax=Actinoplanes sp. NPDC051633 TaxID=3155670 RepID=UPI003413B551
MPEFDRSTPVAVALSTHAGTVDIVAEERVSVLAEAHPLDGSDAARNAADNTLISLEGDTLVVSAPDAAGWSWRRTGKLRITVRVPLDSSIGVKTASADVRATGRFAAARVETASGDIRVEDVTGDAELQAASGNVTVGRVGGSLRIHSSSGDLQVSDVTRDVNADTASGDITVRSAGGSARVETASGDIEVGSLRQGEARLSSASGDVTVGVLAGTGVWLDVNTASGKTRNELTMTGDAPAADTGAKLELRIRTASGDIQIRRVTSQAPAAA